MKTRSEPAPISADPLVSVILPAYNAARFIGETLRSVQSQTYRHLEILVVDDGSTDRTAEIVATATAQDSRITFLQERNQGVAAARNLGLAHARGAYIAPIDSDDLWYPEKIARQVERMRAAPPEVGLVYAWSVKINETGAIVSEDFSQEFEGNVLWPLVLKFFLGNASVPLIRRECLAEVGGYRADLRQARAQGCEDWDLCLRLAERYQFRVVPEYLICYRQTTGTMSCDDATMGRSYSLMMRDFRRRHPEIPRRIYHWSRGSFYMYLDSRCRVAGHYLRAFAWLAAAVWNDPALLFHKALYAAIGRNLIRLAGGSIAPTVFGHRKKFAAFRQRLGQTTNANLSLADLAKRRADRLGHPRIYERIRVQRSERALIEQETHVAGSTS